MSITLPPNVVTLQNDTYSSLLNKLRDRTLSSPEVRSLVKTLTSLIVSSIDIKAQQGEVIAVIVVLRSGLSMFESFMSEIPAESAASASTYHIGIFRDKATLQPVEYYNKLPAKPDAIKRAFVLDPLIATGGTAGAVVNIMKLVSLFFLFLRFLPFYCLLQTALTPTTETGASRRSTSSRFSPARPASPESQRNGPIIPRSLWDPSTQD